jgi:hypothetical protein
MVEHAQNIRLACIIGANQRGYLMVKCQGGVDKGEEAPEP